MRRWIAEHVSTCGSQPTITSTFTIVICNKPPAIRGRTEGPEDSKWSVVDSNADQKLRRSGLLAVRLLVEGSQTFGPNEVQALLF
jgi:hypothetical protein